MDNFGIPTDPTETAPPAWRSGEGTLVRGRQRPPGARLAVLAPGRRVTARATWRRSV